MDKIFNFKIINPFWSSKVNLLCVKGTKFILYIAAAIIIYKIIKFIIQKIIRNKLSSKYFKNKKIKVIFNIVINIIKYIIYFLTIILILRDVFNINPTLIITATGVLGLAVGFGIQGLLRDFISGIAILFENQFNIGDYVNFLNLKGKVIDMNIKNVTVKDNNGNIHIISNGIINRITKYAKKYEMIHFHIFCPKAMKNIKNIFSQIKNNYTKQYKEKINSFGLLKKNDKIGNLNYLDFTVEIQPFNDVIIDSIKELLQRNISDAYIYVDRIEP